MHGWTEGFLLVKGLSVESCLTDKIGWWDQRSVTLMFLFVILRKINKLYMPKFSISTDYSLEKILPQLGIREVFSTQADLSGITGTKDLSVSQVSQDTLGGSHWCLNVDGEGYVCGGWQMCEKPCTSEIPSSSER